MSLIKGIFVNNDGPVPYADLIVDGKKDIETRSRNMLGKLTGRLVVIIATGRGKKPMCIGCAWIQEARKETAETMDTLRGRTFIPAGSKFDTGARWCYYLTGARRFKTPIELPKDAVRHGISWAEWW